MITLLRNRRFLLLSIGVLVAGGIVTLFVVTSSRQAPASEPVRQESTNNPMPAQLDEDHIEDDGEEEVVEVNGQTIPTRIIGESAVPVAEAAAREYVSQRTDESAQARQARLATVFSPSSAVIYDTAPAVDTSKSKDSASSATVLYSRWVVDEQYVVVTVALKVRTTALSNPAQILSEVYQAWNVQIIPDNGTYQAQSVSFSTIPIVVPEAQ